jgi:glycosyltransferase involved in cell wall biosynthesis
MHQYYNNIDVFIVTARLEGGPLSPAEAACCGAPVLSTRCGHMEEMIQEGENGFLCDTIDDFMEKLELLARDRELLRYMSQRSQELVQNWHLESVIPQWLEFLC